MLSKFRGPKNWGANAYIYAALVFFCAFSTPSFKRGRKKQNRVEIRVFGLFLEPPKMELRFWSNPKLRKLKCSGGNGRSSVKYSDSKFNAAKYRAFPFPGADSPYAPLLRRVVDELAGV